MFVNLRFLLIEGMSCSLELQFSLHSLGQLRTLILEDCDMTHVNGGFFPENLEILCFWDCRLPVPLDLPNLEYLQKLEIHGRNYPIVKMLPNTISSLRNLEELHIPNGYEIHDDGSEQSLNVVSAPILIEISKLSRLRSLQMGFRNPESFQDTNIFDHLTEYHIWASSRIRYHIPLYSSVSIKRSIDLDDIQLEGFESLIERAEEVRLFKIDIDVNSMWNSNREAFSDLRNLYIIECNTMGYLARISEDEIHSCPQLTAFSKLTILVIHNCSNVKYLFSKSVAKGLVQLQELRIDGCPVLEAVVKNEDTNDGDIIIFSKLKSLLLHYLPRLKSFYREKEDMHTSPTSVMEKEHQSQLPCFDGMVGFPSLEYLFINQLEDTVSDIWGKYYCTDDGSSFCKLKSLVVYTCDKLETVIPPAMLNRMLNLEYIWIKDCKSLKNVFPPSIARDLIHLQSMEVEDCELLREIIGADEREITDGIVFPELTKLQLTGLSNLTSFWCYQTGEDSNYKVQFPNLVDFDLGCSQFNLGAKELGIDDFTCQRLKVLKVGYCRCSFALSLSVFRSLPLLQDLQIYSSDLEEIVEDVKGDEVSDMDAKTITLLQLKYFTLARLPNVKSFILNINYECHMPALTRVKVDSCGISTLFTFSVLRNLPQLQELEISDCSLLEEIVESVRGDEVSGMDKKTIKLLQLRSVILKDLPKLKSFISSANYECHMPALTKVEVANCGLSTLFTCSVSTKLHQLAKLDVWNCRSLESIVDDVEDDDTSFTDDKSITFSRLASVYLSSLPNLKCFSSSSSCAFSMPKLDTFVIKSCPQMEYFTFLKTSTPMVRVRIDEKVEERIPDLNEYMKQNCKRGSSASDSVEKLSHGDQELETESERVEEQQPQEDTKENELEKESERVEEEQPQEDTKENDQP